MNICQGFWFFFGFYSDLITAKMKAPSGKIKLLENFVNCPLS